MWRNFLTATVSACLLMTLTGCGLFGRNEPATHLPPLPSDLRVCFESTVPAPDAGITTKAEVLDLIAGLKRSELEKTLCGKRLIAFYETFL